MTAASFLLSVRSAGLVLRAAGASGELPAPRGDAAGLGPCSASPGRVGFLAGGTATFSLISFFLFSPAASRFVFCLLGMLTVVRPLVLRRFEFSLAVAEEITRGRSSLEALSAQILPGPFPSSPCSVPLAA